jgi:hypothetical protein
MMRRQRRRALGPGYTLFTFTPAWHSEVSSIYAPVERLDLPHTCGTAWLGTSGEGLGVPLLLRLWMRLTLAVTRRVDRRRLWQFRIR